MPVPYSYLVDTAPGELEQTGYQERQDTVEGLNPGAWYEYKLDTAEGVVFALPVSVPYFYKVDTAEGIRMGTGYGFRRDTAEGVVFSAGPPPPIVPVNANFRLMILRVM